MPILLTVCALGKCGLDLSSKIGRDFLIRIEVKDPLVLCLILGKVFLLSVATPGLPKNSGAQRLGQLQRPIGAARVHNDDVLNPCNTSNRSAEIVPLVEGDDRCRERKLRHINTSRLTRDAAGGIMKIAVIGTGYVGLVAGACFSDTGNTVWCVDKDQQKIGSLREGRIPIYEPGLDGCVARGLAQGRLIFTTALADAVREAEILFLAVGTPALPDGRPDTSALRDVCREVGRAMTGYRIIVNKSTVPVGAHHQVAEWIQAETQQKFDVVSNPEFLKEGSAVEDFMKPDRVIIGTQNDAVFEKMQALYAPFVRQGNPILRMDPTSAELTKYACNSFLATRISFMNELSQVCEKVG